MDVLEITKSGSVFICWKSHQSKFVSILCTDGNVLLDETGQKVKLADFGLTVRCDGYHQDNQPKGTAAFMAPEVTMNCIFVCCQIGCLFFQFLGGLWDIKV